MIEAPLRNPDRDRREIHEVVMRYCRGIDRLQLDLVRDAFHPDGIDHHTGFDGTVEEFIAWVGPLLRERLGGTMHIVANHLVDVHGDEAVSESYATAVHWGEPADDPRVNFTSGVRYVDHMSYRDGRWAIRERWAVREWTRSDAGRLVAAEGTGPRGRRDADDPLRRLQATLGSLRRIVGGVA